MEGLLPHDKLTSLLLQVYIFEVNITLKNG